MEKCINNLNSSKEILVLFETIKGEEIDLNKVTNVDLDKVSLFMIEVSFFPYTCFEV